MSDCFKEIAVGEIAEYIRNGLSVKQSKEPDGLPITRIETIWNEAIDPYRVGYAGIEAGEKEDRLLRKGDILISHINSKKHLGKCALYADVPKKMIHGMNLLCLRPKTKKVVPNYLIRVLQSPLFRAKIPSITKDSVNQSSFNVTNFKKLKIPLPPLPEQRRIAAILDKADAIRRKRQAAIKLADDFLRATFLNMFGDIPAKKSKYGFKVVRPYCSARSGKSSKNVVSEKLTSYPIYGGNGINGWAKEPLYEEPVIIVGRVGQQCGIVHQTDGPSWITDNAIVLKITCKDKLHPIYLAAALENSPIRATVERLDLPFINQSMILDYPLPLPPLAEQKKYAKIVNQYRAVGKRHNLLKDSSDLMFNSLTQCAFRGEL